MAGSPNRLCSTQICWISGSKEVVLFNDHFTQVLLLFFIQNDEIINQYLSSRRPELDMELLSLFHPEPVVAILTDRKCERQAAFDVDGLSFCSLSRAEAGELDRVNAPI